MKNTTLTFDDFLLEKAKKLADTMGISFNAWVNKLVSEAVENSQIETIEELFKIVKLAKGNSNGKKWDRDSIYEL